MSTPEGPDPLASAVAEFLKSQPAVAPHARPAAPSSPVVAKAPQTLAPAADENELASAYDKVLAHEAARQRVEVVHVPLWKVALLPSIAVLLVVAAGWIGFARPAWLYPPPPVLEAPQNRRDAGHMLLTLAIMTSEFQVRTGRLPRSLTELGAPVPGVTYVKRADGAAELTAPAGSRTLVAVAAPGVPIDLRIRP